MDGYFWISYVEFELNDKNVQLQNYPFELIKRMDTCHSRNISYTSYKLSTLYRILNLYIKTCAFYKKKLKKKLVCFLGFF
ncbi:hypothetical protein Hanom_Chr11g00986541 [Helianthus anomalus]